MSKETLQITPRRKRISKTVGREYAVVAFGVIFVLLTANAMHGVYLSRQFSTPEMLGFGVYDDWQQSFAWMQNNLPKDSVILSWWDYGYWITVVGNRTSLMDNGTFNSTQIATLAKALISGDVSALKILKGYGVDYILVHFGYFLAPLSGDEGKWIWMVRIAGDHYPEINESSYYNSTSGKPTEKFFNTLIYKLIFYKEPGSYQFASQVSQYMSKLGYPVYQSYPTSDRWKFVGRDSQYPIYDEAFMSQNNLVKIFSVNYTILDMSLNITSFTAYTFNNKTTLLVTVENNGTKPITLDTSPSSITINGSTLSSLGGSVQIASGSSHLSPGESSVIKIDIDVNSTINSERTIDMKSVDFYGYIHANSSTVIKAAGAMALNILNATAYSNETIFLTVNNTGSTYLSVNSIKVNDTVLGVHIDGDLTLAPGQVEKYRLSLDRNTNPDLNLNVSDYVNLNVTTWESVYATLSNVTVESPPGYDYSIDTIKSYDNETVYLVLSNTGNYSLSLANIYVNSTQVNVITPLNGSTTIAPGTTTAYICTWDPFVFNITSGDTLNVTTVTYADLNRSALVTTMQSNYSILIDPALTTVYTNGTIILTVNNTSPSYNISNFVVYVYYPTSGEGEYYWPYNQTLAPGESVTLQLTWSSSNTSFTAGNNVDISIKSAENSSYKITEQAQTP